MEELFTNPNTVKRIKEKLPKLFRIAEIECSRAGKIGMEVGSTREKILIALLICIYGGKKIDSNIPITEPEIDVIVNGEPVSIKTITGNGTVKASWTVDQDSAINFRNNYHPKCSILLVRTFWGKDKLSFFYIPQQAQQQILSHIGIDRYLNLPKIGTNPRGITFASKAMHYMENHPKTMKMSIHWKQQDLDFNMYKRWIDYWEE